MEEALPNDVKGPRLYPVSILWEPPFTMLVHLVGHGSLQVSLGTNVFVAAVSCCLRSCRGKWSSWAALPCSDKPGDPAGPSQSAILAKLEYHSWMQDERGPL